MPEGAWEILALRKKELEGLAEEWAKALRLGDWDIEVRFGTADEMFDSDGLCYAYSDIKEAEILIRRGKASSKFADTETVLVHELLHCHFEPIRDDTTEPTLEAAIDALSKAFVRMKHNGQ